MRLEGLPVPVAVSALGAAAGLPAIVLPGGPCRDPRYLDYADLLGAELAVVAGCGHYPWVERPEAFRAALGPWLARVSGT